MVMSLSMCCVDHSAKHKNNLVSLIKTTRGLFIRTYIPVYLLVLRAVLEGLLFLALCAVRLCAFLKPRVESKHR